MNTPVIVAIFLGSGLLFAVLAVPMILGRVRPNPFYGLRTRATFADRRVWYRANMKSGRDLLLLGLSISTLAVLLPSAPGMTPVVHASVMVGVTLIGVLSFAAIGIARANRFLRDYRQSEDV